MFHRNLLTLSSEEKRKAFSTFKIEAAGSSETMVKICHTTQCHVSRNKKQ
jgi:hypothetical protein